MKQVTKVLSVLALLAVTAGCSTGTSYLRNRGEDFTDIVRAKVMWGPGAGIKLGFTQYLHLGYLRAENVSNWGWANRSADSWKESDTQWGLIVGRNDEKTTGVTRYAGTYGWRFSPFGFDPEQPGNWFVDSLQARVAIMAYGGVDLQLRMGEILDFVVGIFVLDPSGDDT